MTPGYTRRHFLSITGITVGLGAAGCLGDDNNDSNPTTPPTGNEPNDENGGGSEDTHTPYVTVLDQDGNKVFAAPDNIEAHEIEINYDQLRQERNEERLEKALEQDPNNEEFLESIGDTSEKYADAKDFGFPGSTEEFMELEDGKEAIGEINPYAMTWHSVGPEVDEPDWGEEHSFPPEEWGHEKRNFENAVISEEAINCFTNADVYAFPIEVLEQPGHQDEDAYFHAEQLDDGVYTKILLIDKNTNETTIADGSLRLVDNDLHRYLFNLRNHINMSDNRHLNASYPRHSPLLGEGIEYHKDLLVEYFTGDFFNDAPASESEHIEAIAEYEGKNAGSIDSIDELVDDFDDLLEYNELPELDTGNRPFHRISRDTWPDHSTWDHENIGRQNYWLPLNWGGEEPDLDWIDYMDAAVANARMLRNASRVPQLGQVEHQIGEDAQLALDPEYTTQLTEQLADPNKVYRTDGDNLDPEEFLLHAMTIDALAETGEPYGITMENGEPYIVKPENNEELQQIWQGNYEVDS